MPSRKIEEQLQLIQSLQDLGETPEAIAGLRICLADRVNLVVAKAAAATARLQIRALIPDLLAAYSKLFENGAKRDPQCWAKTAIAKALKNLDFAESDPFVRGLSYQQWEPVWGSEVDTAADLRATCTLALVQCLDLLREDKLWHLLRSLTDACAPVRLEAARGLEQMEGRESALTLRIKTQLGDREPAVTGQVMESLLVVEGGSAVPFIEGFLLQRGEPDYNEEVAECAALALGASRLPEAVDLLLKTWQGSLKPHLKPVILRAIGSSRDAEAFDFLLGVVCNGRLGDALSAIEALAIHRDSEARRESVQTAVNERNNAELQNTFHQAFGMLQ